MVRKTTFSLHETTVESYIIFRPILFFIICVLFAEIYIIHSFNMKPTPTPKSAFSQLLLTQPCTNFIF